MIALFLLCRGKAMASGTEWSDDVDVDPNHAYDLLQNLKQMYKAIRISSRARVGPGSYPSDPRALAQTHPDIFQQAYPNGPGYVYIYII